MPLIKNIEEIKKHCAGITDAVTFDSIAPSISIIEKRVLKRDYLGAALLADLQTAVDDGDLTEEEKELLELVHAALAPLAVAHYVSATLSEIGDAGPREVSSENAVGARLWVFNKQTQTFITDGEEALNDLLDHLEENYFDETIWNESSAFTGLHSALLNSTKLFNDFVFINRSHAFFKSIKPVIRSVEHSVIRKTISKTFYEYLLATRATQELTEEEKEAIELANRATAHFAIAYSKLPIVLGSDGAVQLTPDNRNNEQRVAVTAPSGFDADQYKAQMLDDARTYLLDLRKFLDENSSETVMPLYYNSGLRQDTATAGYNKPTIDNSGFTGVYAL